MALDRMGYRPLYIGGYSNGAFLASLVAQSAWLALFSGLALISGHQAPPPHTPLG